LSSIFRSIKRAPDDIDCFQDRAADPVRNEKQEADVKETVEEQRVVYVIDDDASMRESLKSLFGSVGLSVEAFGAAPEFFGKKLPDAAICLVVDVRLPGLSGLDFQAELSKANVDVPIIFITGHGDIAMSVKAMKAGAVEFFPKPFRDQDLLDAVKLALEKDEAKRRSRKTSAVVRSLFESLTPREQEVIGLVTSGLMNKQVAAEMGVSEITVKVHRGNVMRKMKANSLADLVRMADMLGIRRSTA
jgi:FixJ family two-component response regulator